MAYTNEGNKTLGSALRFISQQRLKTAKPYKSNRASLDAQIKSIINQSAEASSALAAPTPEPSENGGLSSAELKALGANTNGDGDKPHRSVIQKALDFISTANYAGANVVNNWIDSAEKGKGPGDYIGDVFQGVGQGVQAGIHGNNEDNARTFSDVYKRFADNMHASYLGASQQGNEVGKTFFGALSGDDLAATETGHATPAQYVTTALGTFSNPIKATLNAGNMVRNLADKNFDPEKAYRAQRNTNAGVYGFGLDVAADPTTYMTFGIGAIAKGATKGIIAASRGAKKMESAASEISKGANEARAIEAGATAAKADKPVGEAVQFGAPGRYKESFLDRINSAKANADARKAAIDNGVPLRMRDKILSPQRSTLFKEAARRDLGTGVEGVGAVRRTTTNKWEAAIAGAQEELHKFRMDKLTKRAANKSGAAIGGASYKGVRLSAIADDIDAELKSVQGASFSPAVVNKAIEFTKGANASQGIVVSGTALKAEAVNYLEKRHGDLFGDSVDMPAANVVEKVMAGSQPQEAPSGPEAASTPQTDSGAPVAPEAGTQAPEAVQPAPDPRGGEETRPVPSRVIPNEEGEPVSVPTDQPFNPPEADKIPEGVGHSEALRDPDFDENVGQHTPDQVTATSDSVNQIADEIQSSPELADAARVMSFDDSTIANVASILHDVQVPTQKLSKKELKASGNVTVFRYSASTRRKVVEFLKSTSKQISNTKKAEATKAVQAKLNEARSVVKGVKEQFIHNKRIAQSYALWAKKNPQGKLSLWNHQQKYIEFAANIGQTDFVRMRDSLLEVNNAVKAAQDYAVSLPKGGTRKLYPSEIRNELKAMGINSADINLLMTKTKNGYAGTNPDLYSLWETAHGRLKSLRAQATAIRSVPEKDMDHPLWETYDQLNQAFGGGLSPQEVGKKLRALADGTEPGSAMFTAHAKFNEVNSKLGKLEYRSIAQMNSESLPRFIAPSPEEAIQMRNDWHQTALNTLTELNPQAPKWIDGIISDMFKKQGTELSKSKTSQFGATATETEARLNEEINTASRIRAYGRILDANRGIKDSASNLGLTKEDLKAMPIEDREKLMQAQLDYFDSALAAQGVDTVLDNMSPKMFKYENGNAVARLKNWKHEVTVRTDLSSLFRNMPVEYRRQFFIGVDGTKNRMMPSMLMDLAEVAVRSATRLTEDGKIDMAWWKSHALMALYGKTPEWTRKIQTPLGAEHAPLLAENILYRAGVPRDSVKGIVKMARSHAADKDPLEFLVQTVKIMSGDTTDVESSAKLFEAFSQELYKKGIDTDLAKAIVDTAETTDNDLNDLIEAMAAPDVFGISPVGRILNDNLMKTNLVAANLLDPIQKTAIARSQEIAEIFSNGSRADMYKALTAKAKDYDALPTDADKAMDQAGLQEMAKYVPADEVARATTFVEKRTQILDNPSKVLPDTEQMPINHYPEDKFVSEDQWDEFETLTLNEAGLSWQRSQESRLQRIGGMMSARSGRPNTFEIGMSESHTGAHLLSAFNREYENLGRVFGSKEALDSAIKQVQKMVKNGTPVGEYTAISRVYKFMDSIFEFSNKETNYLSRMGIDMTHNTAHRKMFLNELSQSGFTKEQKEILFPFSKTGEQIQKEMKEFDKKQRAVIADLGKKVKAADAKGKKRAKARYDSAVTKHVTQMQEFNNKISEIESGAANGWLDYDLSNFGAFGNRFLSAVSKTSAKITMASQLSSLGSKTPIKGWVRIEQGEKAASKIGALIDQSRYYPKEVLGELDLWDKEMMRNSQIINKHIDGWIRNVFDPTISILKMSQTSIRPGHHFMSILGDAIRNFLLTGKPMMREYKEAAAITKLYVKRSRNTSQAFEDAVRQMGQKEAAEESISGLSFGNIRGGNRTYSLDDIADMADRNGVHLPPHGGGVQEDFLIGEENLHKRSAFRKAADKVTENRLMQSISSFSAVRDTVSRTALFLHYMRSKQFRTVEEAAQYAAAKVREVAPISSDLSEFEQKYARRLIYFYTWMRGMTPVVFNMMVERPGFATLGNKLNYEIAVANGLDPDSIGRPIDAETLENIPSYLSERANGPLFKNSKGDPIAMSLGNPVQDILNTWGSGITTEDLGQSPKLMSETLVGMSSPWLRDPVELYTGNKLDTGIPIKSRWWYMLDQVGIARSASKIVGVGRPETAYVEGDQEDIQRNREQELTNLFTGLQSQNYNTNSIHRSVDYTKNQKRKDERSALAEEHSKQIEEFFKSLNGGASNGN